MSEPQQTDERLWEKGWEGHQGAQRRRLARLPLSEKLAWLEQAHAVVRHLQRGQATDVDRR